MHGGNLRWAREKYGRDTFVDLSANINPFGPPEGVLQSLQRNLGDILHYPDPESKELIKVLSSHLGVEPEWIIAGNGVGELIFTIMQALSPRDVLIPVPAFSEYEQAAKAVGARVMTYPLGVNGWNSFLPLHDDEAKNRFDKAWDQMIGDSDLLFLCSPHNPTGSVLGRDHFERLLDITRQKNCWLILDESFCDFLSVEERWSARSDLKDNPHLVILYSLTKFYSIPGLRLGTAFAHPSKIKFFKNFRDPWSVNVLAQKAGIAALSDETFFFKVQERLAAAKDYLYTEFEKRAYPRLKLYPTSTNFALIELKGLDSTGLAHQLAQKGILVRDCKNFQGLEGEYIRIAIKDISSMRNFLDVLEIVIQGASARQSV